TSLKDVDEALTGPVKDLKDRYYVLTNINQPEDREVIPFLGIMTFDKLLTGAYLMTVHYGTIVRGTYTSFSLTTRWAHRSIGTTSWWKSPDCPRELQDDEGYKVTKCKGWVPKIDWEA